MPAKVTTIEYDPNRSANIALLTYADGVKSYIVAPVGLVLLLLSLATIVVPGLWGPAG